MLSFRVERISYFQKPLRCDYTQSYHAITLSLGGLRACRINGTAIDPGAPFLLLSPRGTTMFFDYPPDRETWGMIIQSDDWKASDRPDRLELRLNGVWTAPPMLTCLDPAHVLQWQREMRSMREYFMDPLPINRIRLELGVLNVLRFVIDRWVSASTGNSPAYQLKRLLESPESRALPLSGLYRRTGHSPESLRKAFRDAFGITPGAYRGQCRMADAMDRIANTAQSVKEIAFALGFRHVSHFSQAFRQAFGSSPREAIARYRVS